MNMRSALGYIVAGVLAVAAVHAGLAAAVSRLLEDRYLQREAKVTQEFLAGILSTEARPDDLFAQPAPTPTLLSFASHVRHMPGVVRANVYSPDGFIRHSTEANLVGVQFKDNTELAESFAGRLVVDMIDAAEAQKEEHLALNAADGSDLMEAYIPVPDQKGKIVAVVEFYRKDTTVDQTRQDTSRLIWLAGLANGLILVVLVWWLSAVRRTA